MPVQYMVTGHCAHATVASPSGGRMRQLFFKGQLLSPDATEAEIAHLLSIKAIAPVAGQSATEPPIQEVESTAPAVTDTVELGDTGGPVEEGGDSGEPSGGEPAGVTEPIRPDSDAEAETERKRAEAQAKARALVESGNKPDGRSNQAVIAEWLVLKGYGREQVASAEKKDLLDLVNGLDS